MDLSINRSRRCSRWITRQDQDHKTRQCQLQEDTTGVIRIRKSKKNRQHNVQKKKNKQRSTKHTNKTNDRVRRIPLKNSGALGRVSSSCSTSGIRRVNILMTSIPKSSCNLKRCASVSIFLSFSSFVVCIYSICNDKDM